MPYFCQIQRFCISNLINYYFIAIKGSRIDDQRSALPHNRQAPTVPDEDFFSLIQKVQSSRLEEQRTILPDKEEEMPTQQSSIKKKKK